jgi:signal transduction histidine kinase
MGGTRPLTLPKGVPVGATGARAARQARRRFAALTPWWSAALALPVLVAVAIHLALASDHLEHPGLAAAYRAYLIGAPMLVGLAWWRRRPASRFGPLLVVFGLAALPLALESSGLPLMIALGVAAESLYFSLYLYLCVAFPEGRLWSWADRLLMAVFGLSSVLYLLPGLLLLPTLPAATAPLAQCAGPCPANPLFVADAAGVVDDLAEVAFVLAVVAVTGLAVLLARRLRDATRAERREVGAVAAVAFPFFLTLIAGCLGSLVDAPPATLRTIGWLFTAAGVVFPLAFLVALVQAELFAGAALRRLLTELAGRPSPGGWRSAVAAALDDPLLQIGYWDPARRVYREADGTTLDPPRAGEGRRWTPVGHAGRPVAAMTTDEALVHQPELLDAAAQATLIAVRTGHLEGELRDARHRLLEAGNAERRRIQRDLHDSAQQRLVALRVHLELAREDLGEDAGRAAALGDLAGQVDETIDDLRRVAHGLFPPTLERYGVAEALRSACRHTALPVRIVDDGLGRQTSAVEATLYFCCLEALQNAAKHSGPDATATVHLGADVDSVWFAVEDDGSGFDPAGARGTGLGNLRDRVLAMGGTLEVDSRAGAGTRIAGVFPP